MARCDSPLERGKGCVKRKGIAQIPTPTTTQGQRTPSREGEKNKLKTKL